MALSIDDLKYLYYQQQVGIAGLSIQDLEYLFFGGQGLPQKPNIPLDPSAVDVLYTPAPTIATTVWADPGATYNLVASDLTGTNFRYRGATDFQFGGTFPDTIMALPTSRFPHTYASPQSIWSVEFMTDAQEFKLYFKYVSATASVYRLKVNGKRVTDLPQLVGGTTVGSRHLMSVDFGSPGVRRVCFEFGTVPFAGVYVPKTATLWKPAPYVDRAIIIGDSIGGGSAINTGGAQGTWVPRLADMLGIDDIWNDCIGGTGYVTRNPGGSFNNIVDRIDADALVYNPRKIVLFAGYNDSASASQVQAAAQSVVNLIQSKAPTARVIMSGPWSPNGAPGASLITVNTALKAVADAAGYVFIDQYSGNVTKGTVTLLSGTRWITGTGNTSAPAGDGNADIYVGSDAVHPNDAGHKYIAARMYAALLAGGFA